MIERLQALGARVVACSDVDGAIYDPRGIDLDTVKRLKEVERRRIRDYAGAHPEARYLEGGKAWDIPCQVALPCATENELDEQAARTLVANGCIAVAEGANMPVMPEGVRVFQEAGIAYGPGKAANAGGVATSALEMSQNAARQRWSFDDSEAKLRAIMANVHQAAFDAAERYGRPGDYVVGANSAGFERVAHAMLAQGVI